MRDIEKIFTTVGSSGRAWLLSLALLLLVLATISLRWQLQPKYIAPIGWWWPLLLECGIVLLIVTSVGLRLLGSGEYTLVGFRAAALPTIGACLLLATSTSCVLAGSLRWITPPLRALDYLQVRQRLRRVARLLKGADGAGRTDEDLANWVERVEIATSGLSESLQDHLLFEDRGKDRELLTNLDRQVSSVSDTLHDLLEYPEEGVRLRAGQPGGVITAERIASYNALLTSAIQLGGREG